MKKAVIVAALVALAWGRPAVAADGHCYTTKDLEAEQALLFMTNLMVVSSACQDRVVYPKFRLRNRHAIIAYQKAMIDRFRRDGYRKPRRQFDRWNTSLANEISLKQGAIPTAQVCRQAAGLLKKASRLDPKGFRHYAAVQAATARATHPKCHR